MGFLVTRANRSDLPLGSLALDGQATPEQLALVIPVTGALAQTATATVRYRESPSGAWVVGHPLHRVRPEYALGDGPTVDDVFAWPIIDLEPGTAYDVEVTVTEGADEVILEEPFTTRALPAASGATADTTITAGSNLATIQAAINGAAAGEIVEFEDGTYALSGLLTVNNTNGTDNSPVYVRGQSRDGVILSRSTNVMQIQTCDNIVFERMTLRGSGVDSGTSAASTGVSFHDASGPQNRITFRNMTIEDVDRGIVANETVNQILVYDCTLSGNNAWTQDLYSSNGSGAPGAGDGTKDIDQNVTWNDDGIGLPGEGNCAFNNTISGFGDTFTLSVGSDHPETRGVFYWRNDVSGSHDDFFEADFGFRNVACYDNRSRNSMTCLSLDPLYGGPLLFARNVLVNVGRTPFKWNDENTGQFVYNNTIIETENQAGVSGWYQPSNGAQQAYGYRNNILIYRGAAADTPWIESTGHDELDHCNNAWYPNTGIQFDGGDYANLAAAQSGVSGRTPLFSGKQPFDNDVITVTNPFTDTITLGATYLTEVTTDYTPVLSVGDNAKNAGMAIPNITDGFSGVAPDMGALIEGRALPQWGDRSSIPAYIAALDPFEVLEITSVSNGNLTIEDVTPAEWLAGDPAGGGFRLDRQITAYGGGGNAITGTKMFLHNGGHNDSANNGMYVFEFAGTTEPTGWEDPLVISAVSAVNANAEYDDGNPVAVHSYGMMQTIGDYVYRFGGSRYDDGGKITQAYRYDSVSKTWGQLTDLPSAAENRGFTIADPATNKIFVWFANGGGAGRFYNANTDAYSGSVSIFDAAWEKTGIRGPGNESIVIGDGVKRVLQIDWAGNSITSDSTFSSSGDDEIFDEFIGLSGVYDDLLDVYWVWGGSDDSVGWTSIYEVNRSTWEVTAHTLTGDAINILGGMVGSWGRIWFHSEWRALGVLANYDVGPSIIRLPST